MSDDDITAVYPRPRGGTRTPVNIRSTKLGLSPPTRGNPFAFSAQAMRSRSIPAHAGEPARERYKARRPEVYPRPRGGTHLSSVSIFSSRGLSPPTRGNPARDERALRSRRSIPAHAGEPFTISAPSIAARVYPRPRGGTCAYSCDHPAGWGLSPPTRGNQRALNAQGKRRGSIPAHAGEPARRRGVGGRHPVYPRPRGGTALRRQGGVLRGGLSPPTRGNRRRTKRRQAY